MKISGTCLNNKKEEPNKCFCAVKKEVNNKFDSVNCVKRTKLILKK